MPTRPANFNYQQYLASREWAVLKRQVKQRSHGHCERCLFGEHEDTHHLTYERIGHELLTDLQGVCRDCHRYLSGLTDHDHAACFVPLPTIQFVSYERRSERDWVGRIQIVGSAQPAFEVAPEGDDADGLFAIIAAMMNPEKVWHPFLVSGFILDAFLDGDMETDEGSPPFIRQLSTCFFPCDGDGCETRLRISLKVPN